MGQEIVPADTKPAKKKAAKKKAAKKRKAAIVKPAAPAPGPQKTCVACGQKHPLHKDYCSCGMRLRNHHH